MDQETRQTPPFSEVNAQGGSKVSAQGATNKVAADARHTAEEVFGEAKAQLKDVGATLQEQALGVFERHRGDVAGQIDDLTQTLRRSGEELRQQKLGNIAHYADSAADAVGDVTTYLRERDGAAMLHDLERAAKQQPLLLYGGLFALGAAGVWFFKNSSQLEATVPREVVP